MNLGFKFGPMVKYRGLFLQSITAPSGREGIRNSHTKVWDKEGSGRTAVHRATNATKAKEWVKAKC